MSNSEDLHDLEKFSSDRALNTARTSSRGRKRKGYQDFGAHSKQATLKRASTVASKSSNKRVAPLPLPKFCDS